MKSKRLLSAALALALCLALLPLSALAGGGMASAAITTDKKLVGYSSTSSNSPEVISYQYLTIKNNATYTITENAVLKIGRDQSYQGALTIESGSTLDTTGATICDGAEKGVETAGPALRIEEGSQLNLRGTLALKKWEHLSLKDTMTISEGAAVTTKKDPNSAAVTEIGPGEEANLQLTGGSLVIRRNLTENNQPAEGFTITLNGSATVHGELTLTGKNTLVVPDGSTLTVADGGTVNLNGDNDVQLKIEEGGTLRLTGRGRVTGKQSALQNNGELLQPSSSSSGTTNYYVVHTYVGAGGTVEPDGSVMVRAGSDCTFTITPDAGYAVADVVVNHRSVGAVTSYTFRSLDANQNLEVTFVRTGTSVLSGNAANPATGAAL